MKKIYVAPRTHQRAFAAPLVLTGFSMHVDSQKVITDASQIESREMMDDRFWDEDDWEDDWEED